MGRTTQRRCVLVGVVAAMLPIFGATRTLSAIEMFTYFGDGSRVGLPTLEVPIEAYPGIPLRSDRLRARRAGTAPPQGTVGPFRRRGITIRVPAHQPVPDSAVGPEPPMPRAATASEADADGTSARAKHDQSDESDQLQLSFGFGGFRDLSAHEQSHSR
jgi:hypothetical protein